MKYSLNIMILLLIISSAFAKDDLIYRYFSFNHPTCNIWLPKPTSNYWDHFESDFRKFVFSKLKEKRFHIKTINDKNPKLIKKGDMHLFLSKNILPKGFYKKCLVKFEIKISSTKFINKSDKILYTRDSLRSLPRHTLKGNERCYYALKDTFGVIPYCTKKNL